MPSSIQEMSQKCWDCGRNIFEAVTDGKCDYCGAEVEE